MTSLCPRTSFLNSPRLFFGLRDLRNKQKKHDRAVDSKKHKHYVLLVEFFCLYDRYLNRHSYNAAEKNSKTVTVHRLH